MLDFQVPLYRLRPRPAQRGMYWGRRLGTIETLDLKNETASVGESWARYVPHLAHCMKEGKDRNLLTSGLTW